MLPERIRKSFSIFMIKKLLDFILYGGSKSLANMELSILRALCKFAPRDDAKVLEEQVKMVSLVQRENNNKMILVFFKEGEVLPLLNDIREELLLAKVFYKLDNDDYQTNVFVHRGKLSSLETKCGIRNEMLSKEIENPHVELCFVVKNGLAGEIDREEHGR